MCVCACRVTAWVVHAVRDHQHIWSRFVARRAVQDMNMSAWDIQTYAPRAHHAMCTYRNICTLFRMSHERASTSSHVHPCTALPCPCPCPCPRPCTYAHDRMVLCCLSLPLPHVLPAIDSPCDRNDNGHVSMRGCMRDRDDLWCREH